MQLHKIMSGSNPYLIDYQIGAAMADAGVPVTVGGAGVAGIALGTTTALVNALGVTLDAQATLVTAQQTDNSDPSRLVRVVANPDAVYAARLSVGATSGTALTLLPVTTASANGLVITTGSEWSSPTYDEGIAWGYDGANAGHARKVTSVSATAGTLTIALPHDTVVGDNFLRAPFSGVDAQRVQLTSDLTEVNAAVAVDTDNANFHVVKLILNDFGGDGRNKSWVHLKIFDHAGQS